MDISTIKARKKELKMTLDEISAKSGIPKRTIEDIFRGATKNPRIDTMQAIEEALELNQSPIAFTNSEKEKNIGNHPTSLSEEEWDWIELLSELKRVKGDSAVRAVTTMINTLLEKQ